MEQAESDVKRKSTSRSRAKHGRVCELRYPTIHDLPESSRPREQLKQRGAAALTDEALVAILIGKGCAGCNAIDLARQVLQRHRGSLRDLGRSTCRELHDGDGAPKGLGEVKAMQILAGLELGRRMEREEDNQRAAIGSPGDVYAVLGPTTRGLQAESFWALYLDVKNNLLGPPMEISRGTLDSSLAHPREVFRAAVRFGTAAIILAHNHPSGDPTPSAEDVRITERIVKAGRVIGIRVLDHVVLGMERGRSRENGYVSLREEGLVDFSERGSA